MLSRINKQAAPEKFLHSFIFLLSYFSSTLRKGVVNASHWSIIWRGRLLYNYLHKHLPSKHHVGRLESAMSDLWMNQSNRFFSMNHSKQLVIPPHSFEQVIVFTPCVPIRRAYPYAIIPSKGLPSWVRASKCWRVYGTKQLFLEEPFCVIMPCPHGGAVIMEIISSKDHGSPKCPSVEPFEILHSKGPFEVASFEHFGLERPFNMTAMIVFTPKCPSEGDISRLERTDSSWSDYQILVEKLVWISSQFNLNHWDSAAVSRAQSTEALF